MLNFNNIRTKSEYEQLRLALLKSTEEIILSAYVDPLGIATIGLGMNLRDDIVRGEVLNTILGINNLVGEAAATEESYREKIVDIVSKTYPNSSAGKLDLQFKLDRVMSERAADSRITFTNKRSNFAFLSEQEAINTFNSLTNGVYEKRVDDWIGSIVPDSYERLVLVSLAYNGGLGSKLRTAIQDNNRPEAWYEIRYNSNLDNESTKNIVQGIAKRRYYESQIFGLYNDRNQNPNFAITNSEAESVFKTYSNHQSKIKEYDRKFGAQIDAANNIPGKIVTVQNFNDATARARNYLVSSYAPGSSIDEILINSDSNIISEELKTVRSNVLIFGEGDIIYSLSSLFGQDQIIASGEGIIKISGVELAGDALTKTSQVTRYNNQAESHKNSLRNFSPENDFTGENIDKKESQPASKWTLKSYDLTRAENDLVITKAAIEPSAKADSITIKNFPFTSNQAAFGINLDRKIIGLSPEEIYQDEGAFGRVIASQDARGRFFAPTLVFIGPELFNYVISTYDYHKNLISSQSVTNIEAWSPTKYEYVLNSCDCAKLDNGNVAFVYIINGQVKTMDGSYFEDKSSAFLTIIDPNGVVISNRIVGELIAINDSNKFNHNNYALCFVSKNGMIFHGSDGNQFFAAKLNESQLAKVGVDDLDAYRDNYQDSLIVATLPTGHKVTATGGPGIPKSQGSFKIASPIYAAKTTKELIPNYDITNNYVTNPDQKQLILSVPPEAKTDIKISSNPNSVTIINGFDADTNANKLTFPVDLNLVKIDKVLSSQYSVIDLLAGKFAPSDLAPNKNLQLVPLEKTLSLEEENKILRDNNDKEKVLKIWSKAWSNDNEQLKANEEDKFLDLDQESSILLLPKKQAVVMFGVANANLINHPENYFSQNQLPANDSSKQFPTTTIIGISAALLGAVGLGFVARKYAANRNNDRIAVPTSELDEQNNDLEVPNSEVEIMEMRHNVKAERDKAKVVSR